MALKLTNSNYYIKIDLQGNFKIYKTAKDRLSEKNAPQFEDIILKYATIIHQLRQDKERLYYDPNFIKLIRAWEEEAELYSLNHFQGIHSTEFPLMAEYIPNIAKSLPRIIHTGSLGVLGNTVEEVYEYVKRVGYFNDALDC